MRSATELKAIFRQGWSHPDRVNYYAREVAKYTEGQCPEAWRRCLAAALAAPGRLRILDLGTGPGMFACLYAQLGHEAVGLDFSDTMLATARRLAAQLEVDCTFLSGDAEEPPFPDATFDAVSSRSMIFMLPRPGLAVRQWLRILKPGGKLILIGNRPARRPWFARPACVRRLTAGCLGRLAGSPRAVWTKDAAYQDAENECPLARHTPGALWAVLEAAGFHQIRFHPADEIYPAALRSFSLRRRLDLPLNQPYVLIGVKPTEVGSEKPE